MTALSPEERSIPRRADFAGEPCLVLGAGRSGRAAADQLAEWDARVTLYDRSASQLADIAPPFLTASGPEPPRFEAFRWIVQSPGVPVAADPRVIPEIDLASLNLRAPMVGITGTNGKSTTTVLTAAMLRQSGLPVELGGNLGTPLCVLGKRAADWLVVELSSFQLEHARWIRPRVAVLLNLADDHFDRHRDLEDYGRAKARLAELLEVEGTLVFNLDDAWASQVAADRKSGPRLGFSTRVRPARGAYLEADALVLAPEGAPLLRVPLAEVEPSCSAHPANALAAMLAAHAAGASPSGIRAALRAFEGLPHRSQVVAVKRGVAYVNDSKATNPAAARASLERIDRPVIWLAGGVNKGLDFAPLAEVAERVRLTIVYGSSAEALARALTGRTSLVRVDTLDAALDCAVEHAQEGDVVLLSPACASFDQFANFEARGDHFAARVRELPC